GCPALRAGCVRRRRPAARDCARTRTRHRNGDRAAGARSARGARTARCVAPRGRLGVAADARRPLGRRAPADHPSRTDRRGRRRIARRGHRAGEHPRRARGRLPVRRSVARGAHSRRRRSVVRTRGGGVSQGTRRAFRVRARGRRRRGGDVPRGRGRPGRRRAPRAARGRRRCGSCRRAEGRAGLRPRVAARGGDDRRAGDHHRARLDDVDRRAVARACARQRRAARGGGAVTILDPVTVEVLRHAFEGVADEMGAVLRRTSYSPNIKERADCSAAVFSATGDLVAQAEHIPVHLGSMPASVDAALHAYPRLAAGDQVLLNDPWAGGTHLNDYTLVAPVFQEDLLLGYVANRAHHTDVGGMARGSIPAGATDVFAEGVRVPPVLLYRGGRVDEGTLRFVAANSRTPDERRGDLLAQAGANARGAGRLVELAQTHGAQTLSDANAALADYAEARVAAALEVLPRGEWTFTDELDDDGAGAGPVPIVCTLRIRDEGVVVDFTGSAAQTRGGVNAVAAVARSAACFVLRCLVPADVPVNEGCWRRLRVI